jgi:hypothetical protein
MAAPLDAPYRAGVLGDSFRGAAASPHELFTLAGALSGARVRRLADFRLADRYEAQVFAQGVGYFEGLGMLLDDGEKQKLELLKQLYLKPRPWTSPPRC